MADTDIQPDDAPQSFVVRIWQESGGSVRGMVRHVQSQSQRGFTRFSQAQQFIEQYVTRLGTAPLPAEPVESRLLRWPRMSRRRTLQTVSALMVAAAVIMIVIAANQQTTDLPLFGSAVGQGQSGEVLVALFVGLVVGALVGGLGCTVWLRLRR
jgi:ferric-dicitrate binding protein FerR (iron transport regulator)